LAFATVTLGAITDSCIILRQEGSDEAVSKALSRNFLQSGKQDVSLAATDKSKKNEGKECISILPIRPTGRVASIFAAFVCILRRE